MKAELPVVGERAERCETCRWWKGEEGDDDEPFMGECHRYPPKQEIFDAVIRAINRRDAFLNRERKDRESYLYDCDLHNPYEFSNDEYDDQEDHEEGMPETTFWPEVCIFDFCGEWAVIPASLQGKRRGT